MSQSRKLRLESFATHEGAVTAHALRRPEQSTGGRGRHKGRPLEHLGDVMAAEPARHAILDDPRLRARGHFIGRFDQDRFEASLHPGGGGQHQQQILIGGPNQAVIVAVTIQHLARERIERLELGEERVHDSILVTPSDIGGPIYA